MSGREEAQPADVGHLGEKELKRNDIEKKTLLEKILLLLN